MPDRPLDLLTGFVELAIATIAVGVVVVKLVQ
jgi:hypothetical protein